MLLEKYYISVAGSSKSTNWKRKGFTWDELIARLCKPKVGDETTKEFDLLPRSEKAVRKDVGGYVGGVLSGGRRTKSSVTSRCLITLDVDYGDDYFWDEFTMFFDCAAVIYGTRSDRPNKRRYRLVIPLDREIESREEYEAAARKVAEIIGIELFDTTTFQPERLMYWGSVSSDQDYYFDEQIGEALCVDDILAEYGECEAWRDTRLWAFSNDEEQAIRTTVAKTADPTTKPGVIGAFCRTYTVSEAIEAFLTDVYEDCGNNRYTYKGGSSAAGMVVYDDKFAYSHHSTDPIGDGHTYNAYDLVRVHKFGFLGKGESETEMSNFVKADEKCVRELVSVEDYLDDFDLEDDVKEAIEEEKLQWDLDRRGNKLGTTNNIINAFKSDKLLNKLLGYDKFRDVIVYTRRPFFDPSKKRGDLLDDTGQSIIACRIERLHSIYNGQKLNDAIECLAVENAFHPIKDYLDGTKWDETPRIDTFMAKYMGAEQSIYTSESFRKMLVAAVARIYDPGKKFDTAFIMVSKQGAGKSTLVSRLSKGWFNDSLVSLEGTKAYEVIQHAWLVELAELSALKKTEVEVMKNFISKTEDTYRAAFARRVKTHKRQCVFFGSTNDDTFLKDQTGNRRFFPVPVKWNDNSHFLFEADFEQVIDQLWAEAVVLYRKGESLLLSPEAEKLADNIRDKYTERPMIEGQIEAYVNMSFPDDWDTMGSMDRRDFVDGIGLFEECHNIRDEFSLFEIWCDCLGGKRLDFTAAKARELSQVMKRQGFNKGERKNVKLYGRQAIYVREIDELLL